MAELITGWTKEELKRKSPKLSNSVTAYRAGYLPMERREIENRLKTKNLVGVVSTNALELGIDIGSLDSVIISGYPGTVISTWQQAGRAGRTNSDSLVTLVAFQNPLDQYFMKHPQDFF
jgi:DEAD/DEAH box helicase domain-containing protein